jgi:hypothetical protein
VEQPGNSGLCLPCGNQLLQIARASDSEQAVPLVGNMSQPMGMMAGVSGCVTLAGRIMGLLMTAKGGVQVTAGGSGGHVLLPATPP